MKVTKSIVCALAPAAMLALAACTTTHDSPFADSNSSTYTKNGVPGGIIVNTKRLTAKVTDIDAANRVVTMVDKDGQTTTVECGPGIRNFDQIHVGDTVKTMVTEQLAVSVSDTANASQDGTTTTVLLSPKGGQPGGIVAATKQTTAKLTGIDTLRHHVTLRFPDDTLRTFAARPDVDIADLQIGQDVVIRGTQAYAIWVTPAAI